MSFKLGQKIIDKLAFKKSRQKRKQKLTELAELKNYKTWVPPGHFYSPIPNKDELIDNFNSFNINPPNIAGINLNDEVQLDFIKKISHYYQEMPFEAQNKKDLRYYFENDAYSYSDAICLYGMIRELKPKKIIEIGSGFSSALMLDTNEKFLNNQIDFTFIEPYPELLLSLLNQNDHNNKKINILDKKLQEVDLNIFKTLEANDILFIDSTHVAKAFSDVQKEIFEVLPLLNKGVFVHFHDIFYPFEYPQEWLLEGRAWNEAYLLRAFLQYNNAFEIALFNTYLYQKHNDILKANIPLSLKNSGGSIWLKKYN